MPDVRQFSDFIYGYGEKGGRSYTFTRHFSYHILYIYIYIVKSIFVHLTVSLYINSINNHNKYYISYSIFRPDLHNSSNRERSFYRDICRLFLSMFVNLRVILVVPRNTLLVYMFSIMSFHFTPHVDTTLSLNRVRLYDKTEK